MASLSFSEKRNLVTYLQMGGGYVLDFSNRTFQEFVGDSTGLDIDDPQIGGSGSKASRLRHFWSNQPDHVVGKLLKDLIQHRDQERTSELGQKLTQTAERLLKSAPVHDADVFSALSQREEFEQLVRDIQAKISSNSPQLGLDRLHTCATKFARTLCDIHSIPHTRDEPLHSLFGKYTKKLKELGRLESQMSERILKSSIGNLEAFNKVRNDESLAHDNPLLNHNESLLILNHVTSVIRFVWTLEQTTPEPNPAPATQSIPDDDEILF